MHRSLPLTFLVKLAGGVLTFHIVAASWVLFRAHDFETASQIFTQIATNFQPQIFGQWIDGYMIVAVMMAVGFFTHFMPSFVSRLSEKCVIKMPLLLQALLIVAATYLFIQVKSSDVQPFIYFQF